MAGVEEVTRSIGEMRQGGQDVLDGLSGGASGVPGSAHGLADFFRSPDNLLALAVCLLAVIGIYRLLRAENIIPAPRPSAGGGLLASFLARRLAVRLVFVVLIAAVGLALAMGRLAGVVELLKRFF